MVKRTDEWVADHRRPIHRSRLGRGALACLVALGLIATGCSRAGELSTDEVASGDAENASTDQATPTPLATSTTDALRSPEEAKADALDRAVVITTTNCGDAGDSIGSGIALGDGRVLTAAHVIAGATDIGVMRVGDYHHAQRKAAAEAGGAVDSEGAAAADPGDRDEKDWSNPATIIAFDSLRDLALLEVGSGWSSPSADPAFAVAAADDAGTIIGGVTSGDVDFTVTEKTIIEMDEVRGTRRSQRSGYLIDAETARGDSGAGLYDGTGHLVGVLFAVSTGNNRRSWATAGDELEEFLADDSVTGTFACDPEQSKLVKQP